MKACSRQAHHMDLGRLPPARLAPGRLIDIATGVGCLGAMAVHPHSAPWLVVWGASAAMAFLSAVLDTTGRFLRWLRFEYPKRLRVIAVAGALHRGLRPARRKI